MSFLKTFANHPSQGSFYSALFAERNIHVKNNVSFGDLPRYKLDIYQPHITNAKTPVIIFYYGGGWDSGERQMYGFVGSALASQGYITVIPDYRLYPEVIYPDFMTDIGLAYIWTRNNIMPAGETTPKIFIMGHSAGAHMAALFTYNQKYLYSLDKKTPMPDGFIGLSGPYGYNPLTHERSGHIFEKVSDETEVQPIHQVRKNAPPALLLHGKKDKLVLTLNAYRMRDALHAVGAQAEAIELAKAGHINLLLALSKPFRHRLLVLSMINRFISNNIRSNDD